MTVPEPIPITADELVALIEASGPAGQVLHTSYGRVDGPVLYATPGNRWALLELASMRNIDLGSPR